MEEKMRLKNTSEMLSRQISDYKKRVAALKKEALKLSRIVESYSKKYKESK